MKYILLIFSTFYFVTTINAQQFIERVYLKDSITFYEGYIIEQAPSKYVKIYRLKQKDTLQVGLINVWKLTKEYAVDSTKKIKPIKEKKGEKFDKVAFLELGGNAGVYSLNFDMRTAKGKRNGWGFRAGFEYIGIDATDSVSQGKVRLNFKAFPLALNYLFGKRKSFLELGVGATYVFAGVNGKGVSNIDQYQLDIFKDVFTNILGVINVGYRHVPYKNGIMYKIVYSPLLVKRNLIPFWGLAIGYHFK